MSIAFDYGERDLYLAPPFVIEGTINETGTSIRARNSFHSSQ